MTRQPSQLGLDGCYAESSTARRRGKAISACSGEASEKETRSAPDFAPFAMKDIPGTAITPAYL